MDAVVLCQEVRSMDLSRVSAFEVDGEAQHITSPELRDRVRNALSHHLGLDLPATFDGAEA